MSVREIPLKQTSYSVSVRGKRGACISVPQPVMDAGELKLGQWLSVRAWVQDDNKVVLQYEGPVNA